MVNSMTGFGRAELTFIGGKLLVEMRTVNHRFLDVHMQLPTSLRHIEQDLLKLIKSRVNRGKFDLKVEIEENRGRLKKLQVNETLYDDYIKTMRRFMKTENVEQKISLDSSLIDLGIIEVVDDESTTNGLEELVLNTSKDALVQLLSMRETEGEYLYGDVYERLLELEQMELKIKGYVPEVETMYRERLESKLSESYRSLNEHDERLHQEIAFLLDKSDITEELTRLHSHRLQFLQTLTEQPPMGRKLEFILQEMNREINTIGSKANHAEISKSVVSFKAELEKLREQAQNIE
ncbi:YicC/YloC family endoribonuclease [Geomicrobium sp. JCM 19038]|uniref:YicC/YloC family endoribonuclease n=1 Tax=Geomicrobium sp. JCM 19038 TaxID=1460635 RepID=UPI00045F45C9|nr:YicC/YloC family endoribonuclease [Geomicrobium sp. JCM 19038]GAK07462.1 YicC protein [Geomicrobium sp. JCM 19038]